MAYHRRNRLSDTCDRARSWDMEEPNRRSGGSRRGQSSPGTAGFDKVIANRHLMYGTLALLYMSTEYCTVLSAYDIEHVNTRRTGQYTEVNLQCCADQAFKLCAVVYKITSIAISRVHNNVFGRNLLFIMSYS